MKFVAIVLLAVATAVRAEVRTAFEFTRALQTCDVDQDNELAGTSRVVYSWNDEDPEGAPEFHGANRGSQSLNLLGANPNYPIDDDAVVFELLMEEHFATVPETSTSGDSLYYCKLVEIPNEPYHVVKYDMIVQPGNEQHVHHALVYECPQAEPVFERYPNGFQGECPFVNPTLWADKNGTADCEGALTMWAWAIGGGANTFPPNIGYPIGSLSTRFMMIEMHYDLPGGAEIMDASGVELTVTPTLRETEAGILQYGALSTGRGNFQIPPGQEAYDFRGWCPHEALGPDIADTEDGELTLLSVFLHAHLTATGIKVGKVRNGTELAPIRDDQTYDFNYQQYQWFADNPVTLKPDDDIVVTCTYNTLDRTEVTVGGGSSSNEMCLAFFIYWPRLPQGGNCWLGEEFPLGPNTTGTITIYGDGQRRFDIEAPTIEEPFEPIDTCSAVPAPGAMVGNNMDHPKYGSATDFGTIDSSNIEAWRSSFDHMAALGADNSYNMYWTVHSANETIRFGIDVATEGWVGFGFSPNGGMVGSDVIMAWIDDDGEAHFSDRMAVEQDVPVVDTLQDSFSISGVQYETEQVLSGSVMLEGLSSYGVALMISGVVTIAGRAYL